MGEAEAGDSDEVLANNARTNEREHWDRLSLRA